MKNKLALIIPCFNEEEILDSSVKRLQNLLSKMKKQKLIASDSFICFVDDGSRDKTASIIERLSKKNTDVRGILLSRNFGQQGATLAGFYNVDADMYVSIDVDLQDDPNAVIEMVKEYKKGNDIVFGVMNRRETDTFIKRNTAKLFYKIMKWLGVDMVPNNSEFRLVSRRVVETFKENFHERTLFLRASLPLVGYKSSKVYFDRSARTAGQTKYSIGKLISLAIDGITSFSVAPLRLVALMGIFVCFLSFLFFLYAMHSWIINKAIPGWTSMVTAVTFLGGVQLLSLGIIGEYIGKIYKEVKARPLFIIDRKLGFPPNQK